MSHHQMHICVLLRTRKNDQCHNVTHKIGFKIRVKYYRLLAIILIVTFYKGASSTINNNVGYNKCFFCSSFQY